MSPHAVRWGALTRGRGRGWNLRLGWFLLLLLLLLLVGVPNLLCLLLLLLPPIGNPLLSIVHVAYWSLLAIAVCLVLPIPITILLSHLLHTSEHCKKKTEKVLNKSDTSLSQIVHTSSKVSHTVMFGQNTPMCTLSLSPKV